MEHPPECRCGACAGKTAVILSDSAFDTAWRKIPRDVEDAFLEGVWRQDILPNRPDRAMWIEHFTRLLNHAQAGWGRAFNAPQSLAEWEMFQRIERNLRDFAAHKQHRMIEELRDLKAQGLSRADWEDKARGVLRRHNRLYLRAEVQAATAGAQAAESWQEFQRRKYLYPNLRYETAGDERVRESHRSLDGIVKPVDDPFWDVYYPPNGWNCRCKVIQTDEHVSPADQAADFDPPKGFRGNVGKTGQLFGEDHPYFDVAGLDREALENQATIFHAAITRPEVREWAKENLVDGFSKNLPGIPRPVTLSNREVKTITGKPHQDAPGRNELLYVLSLLTGEDLRYLGTALDAGTHPQVQAWYYFSLTVGGENYFLNLWRLINDEGAERIGIHAITDTAPDFGGP